MCLVISLSCLALYLSTHYPYAYGVNSPTPIAPTPYYTIFSRV